MKQAAKEPRISSLARKTLLFLSSWWVAFAFAGISIAAASLTLTGTNLLGDNTITIDGPNTISIGTTSSTGITIGRSGQTVTFPGTFVGKGPVIQAEAFGASPSSSAASNVTAIQAALNAAGSAGGGTVTLLTTGTFLVNSTLVLPQGGNIQLILGKSTTIKRANGQNTPMLQSYNYNHYASLSTSTFVGPITNASNGLALGWTSGNTVTVTWNNHGFASGAQNNYVSISGASPSTFNGVFKVASVVNANQFTIQLDRVPAASPTGIITAMVVDSNIVIEGGIWNGNRANQTVVELLDDVIDLGGVQNVHLRDLMLVDSGFYSIDIGAARDVLTENIEVNCNNNCAAIVGEGPLTNARFINSHGITTDDAVWVMASKVGSYNGTWTTGDVSNIVWDGVDFYQSGGSSGEVVAWAPVPTTAYMGGLTIKNVNGIPYGCGVTMGSSQPNSVLDSVRIENVSNLSYTSTCGVSFRADSGSITINKADLHNLTGPSNYVANGNAILVASSVTIHQLSIDSPSINNTNYSGALLNIQGAVTHASISNCDLNMSTSSGSPSYLATFAASSSLGVLEVSRCNITGPANGFINGPPATATIILNSNNWTGPYGAVLSNAGSVIATGNTFSGFTGGVVRVNGSVAVNYNLYGNTLSGGSVAEVTGSGSPTLTSNVCDLAGNCTSTGKATAAGFAVSNSGTSTNGTSNAPAISIYGNNSSQNGFYMGSGGNLDVAVGGSTVVNFIGGFGFYVPGGAVKAASFYTDAGPMLISSTPPTIASGFNTSGYSVSVSNGTASFLITVGTGTGTATGTLTLPAANVGWNCFATNRTRAALIQQTGADSATSVTLTNYGTGFAATNWTNSDVIQVSCFAH